MGQQWGSGPHCQGWRTPLTATPLLPHVQKKNYERLQKALDSVMSIREMTQVCGVAPAQHFGPV